MTRPGFARGLGPTPWEYFIFSLWLVMVIISMIAMVRVPLFNLFFWPTLWIYDLWQEVRPRALPDSDMSPRPTPAELSRLLWDRELDS
jgi:hypothetical protein